MGNAGWIKIYRQLEDCWIWLDDEPFDKRSAWIDLLLMANHEDKQMMFNGVPIIVQRGQRMTSIKALAEKWKWSRHKVSDFLNVLERDNMIVQNRDTKRTLINIVNYSIYQLSDSDLGHQKDTQGTSKGHQKDTNKNERNKELKESNTLTSITKEKITEPEADVELIPLSDNSGWRPTMSEYEEYQRLFPNVDIDAEFRKMRSWCLANTRKTRRGIKRFVNSWLSKAQDRPQAKVQKTTGNKFNKIIEHNYNFDDIEARLLGNA